jgi:hypothetical protein
MAPKSSSDAGPRCGENHSGRGEGSARPGPSIPSNSRIRERSAESSAPPDCAASADAGRISGDDGSGARPGAPVKGRLGDGRSAGEPRSAAAGPRGGAPSAPGPAVAPPAKGRGVSD